jgi:hypothetical protein
MKLGTRIKVLPNYSFAPEGEGVVVDINDYPNSLPMIEDKFIPVLVDGDTRAEGYCVFVEDFEIEVLD